MSMVMLTNLAPNGSVDSAAGWGFWGGSGGGSGSGARSTATPGYAGPSFWRATWATDSNSVSGGALYTGLNSGSPFEGGKQYSVSAHVRSNVLRRLTIGFEWKTAAGVSIVSNVSEPFIVPANSWEPLKVSFPAPANAVRAQVTVYGSVGGASWKAGDTLDVDALIVTQTSQPVPYFDGDSGTVPIEGTDDVYVHGWLGAPGQSASGQICRRNPDIGPKPEQTNHVINPSFEAGTFGWVAPWSNSRIDVVRAPAAMSPEFLSGTHALKVTSTTPSSTAANIAPESRIPVTPGQIFTVSTAAYNPIQGQKVTVAIVFYTKEGRSNTIIGADFSDQTTRTLEVSYVVPKDHYRGSVLLQINSIAATPAEAYFDQVTTSTGPYFDGDTPDEPIEGSSSYYRHEWLGLPHRSASTRTLVTHTRDWTKRWYSTLPHAYQAADKAQQQPGHTEQPLLHFMDGIGQVAGRMRHISDQAWRGDLTNPDTTPDHALPWLGQMLGAPVSMQNLPLAQLRTHLQDMRNDGRPAVGTRAAIITAARQFLTGDSQALIPPTSAGTPAHTIIMLVRSDQVPDGNLAAIEQKIRATGVIPAGHALSVRMARSSWDGWQAAAGITWNDVEKNTKTWAIADSLGIELEP